MVMRPSAVVALLIASASVLGAQPPTERVRAGTASIAGRITEADTKRPLAGVLVTLIAQNLRARLTTETSADGHYIFEAIAPAPYIVEANHPDYVPARFVDADPQRAKTQYLWVAPANPHRTGVDLTLVPAGTINGRVMDEQGRPLENAMVTRMQMVSDPGGRISGPPSMTRSSAAGGYSLRQVPEGAYLVGVTWLDPEAMKAKASIRSRPTYYPGTDKVQEAATIRVARGETVNNIDIVLIRSKTYAISGHVLRIQTEGPLEMHLVAGASSTRTLSVEDDGAFSATHLQPGRYTIWARAKEPGGSEAAM
ncbi:MAG TPA: carboxypeptidase-like regulatory domain-containing protein, partial [Vicinamibacterales bacterium]|nr:carboxypeptidase-like regulatory domain-containing protein [Vicinamibacterales bacterium]